MRVRNVQRRAGEGVELQMTPMIDIVFQLLIFFIMTFKIVAPEGDFNIKMPLTAPTPGKPDPTQLPPITVRMTANSNGSLAEIRFGNRRMVDASGRPSFQALRQAVIGMLGDEPGPSVLENTEVELDCDYHLRYENVIEAVTAVSGYVDEDRIVKLVEKIKFAPQHRSK